MRRRLMTSTFSIIDIGIVLRSTEPLGLEGIRRRPSIRTNRAVGAESPQVAVRLSARKTCRALYVADFAHAWAAGELRQFADRAIERSAVLRPPAPIRRSWQ